MDDEPIILLFLTGKWETDCRMKEEARWRIWDERPWIDALFSRSGSMAEPRRNISQPQKVCCVNPTNIWYVGM